MSGDEIALKVVVEAACTLLLLTQGSTKVFKTRPYSLAGLNDGKRTLQTLSVIIEEEALLLLLPSPVTCFANASYTQVQTFRLISATSSLVLLDSYTSGRMARGEEWSFDSYRSTNEIYISGKQVAKDALLLENNYRQFVHPYSCYATLFLFGPKTLPLLHHFKSEFHKIVQYKSRIMPDLIWSFSELEKGTGGIVRVAATRTESVKEWLQEQCQSLESLIGKDAYRHAWTG